MLTLDPVQTRIPMSQFPMSQFPLPQAEAKLCPRCQAPFECRVGNIPQCQCNGIRLTAEDKAFIAANYTDCLCRACLLAITASSRTPA
jgi:hypothetical protein